MRASSVLIIFLLELVRISVQKAFSNNEFYKAAVVEFSPNELQEDNLKEFEWFIEQTKKEGADIVVFPEYALHGTNEPVEKLSRVPDPEEKVIPCSNEDQSTSQVLEKLSCGALNNMIYVVVNLAERGPRCNAPECASEERVTYNTTVVFDRKGMVIHRYRKESYGIKANQSDLDYFDTDFGVRFGIFTGFEILLESRAVKLIEESNITNFVYPSYWKGSLPFLSAIQVQSGWSYAMNVNLLAAGTGNPSVGAGGSGIYMGKKGPLIYTMPDTEASLALTGKVPKNVRTMTGDNKDMYETSTIHGTRKTVNSTKSRIELFRDPSVLNFDSVVLDKDGTEFNREVCTGRSLCCRFKITYKKNQEITIENKSYEYRAIAYQGELPMLEEVDANTGGVDICAVILCTGPGLEDCGRRPAPNSNYILSFSKLSVEAIFNDNQTVQMPNMLFDYGNVSTKTKLIILGAGHYNFQTLKTDNKRQVKISLKEKDRKNLLTFGIYSRDFSKSTGFVPFLEFSLMISALIFVKLF